jgi:hypothetical protein
MYTTIYFTDRKLKDLSIAVKKGSRGGKASGALCYSKGTCSSSKIAYAEILEHSADACYDDFGMRPESINY